MISTSFLPLTPDQCQTLMKTHHVYLLPSNGRINLAGLNDVNIERAASAIDAVVRSKGQKF